MYALDRASVSKKLMAFLLPIALITALFVPRTASAADYGLDFNGACRSQYDGPQYYAVDIYGGAYGWTCYYNTYGFPLALTMTSVGGLDLQRYCSRVHPGSRAVLRFWHPLSWTCRV